MIITSIENFNDSKYYSVSDFDSLEDFNYYSSLAVKKNNIFSINSLEDFLREKNVSFLEVYDYNKEVLPVKNKGNLNRIVVNLELNNIKQRYENGYYNEFINDLVYDLAFVYKNTFPNINFDYKCGEDILFTIDENGDEYGLSLAHDVGSDKSSNSVYGVIYKTPKNSYESCWDTITKNYNVNSKKSFEENYNEIMNCFKEFKDIIY